MNCDIPYIRIENPIGVIGSRIFWYDGLGDGKPRWEVFPRHLKYGGRKADQVLQPWMFGHGETKATCLWNKNLPKIIPTNIVDGRYQRMHLLPKTKDRAELRSKTYLGIAEALAKQTVEYITSLLQSKQG